MKKPLLLAPAGGPEALKAAINAGADEIYFGAKDFNARYGAKNFTDVEFAEALKLCRLYGVKSNITVNTLVTDREMTKVLKLIYNAASAGADSFIVQDIGLARTVKKLMPEIELHASTQCACHSLEGAKKLVDYGFKRIVLARELCFDDIRRISAEGIETEIFVHGALCVCHSGMCLMSSVIGSRSGNRGMCAQPCRLPYRLDGSTEMSYPLSLKDLSLSQNILRLLNSGVTSLKIEGRMKSPEYVGGVVSVWRELLDTNKNADKESYKSLEKLFSRGGFTSSYFTSKYRTDNRGMYGVRSDADKANTHNVSVQSDRLSERKVNIELECEITEGERARVFAKCRDVFVQTESEFVCESAKSAPVTKEELESSLSKLGGTCFCVGEGKIKTEICGNPFLSKSMINSLRRDIVDKLTNKLLQVPEIPCPDFSYCVSTEQRIVCIKPKIHLSLKCAQTILIQREFDRADFVSLALEFFENPDKKVLEKVKSMGAVLGVRLPRVIFNNEYDAVEEVLKSAVQNGAKYALVSNVGQIEAVKKCGLWLFGDIGMNVYNSASLNALIKDGFEVVTLSPELNSAQIRDIERTGKAQICAFAKGTLPLMVLESCVVRANGHCSKKNTKGCSVLHDRKGFDFPVYGEKRFGLNPDGSFTSYPCRNIIYNSVSADILSKPEEIKKMNVGILTVIL